MNKLTEDEILKYICEENKETGVRAITRQQLESIDLDTIPDVVEKYTYSIKNSDGITYIYDSFTPRAGVYAWCPSFAGSQYAIAKEGRNIIFTNGRGFIVE